MGRPKATPGTHTTSTTAQVNRDGKWTNAPQGVRPERWRARAVFYDHDGKTREVTRFATRKSDAEAALREAILHREAPRTGSTGSGVIRSDMSVEAAAAVWLARIARPEAGLADNTRAQYRGALRRYVEGSPFALLPVREANRPPVVRSFLEGIADDHGSGAAKTARTVVSLILGAAVDDGALDMNGARQVRTPKRSTAAPVVETARAARLREAGISVDEAARDTRRSFTRDQRAHVIAFAAADEYAQRHDVADLIAYLAGTGVRISEALGQRWEHVDLSAGTVRVEGTKTAAARRTLHLSPSLADVLRARKARGVATSGLVFPSPLTGGPRDQRNTFRHLRSVLDRAGFPWATSHAFRRTVATMLDEAGKPITLAANVLGHANPAMTASVYLGRRGDTSAAAAVLDL